MSRCANGFTDVWSSDINVAAVSKLLWFGKFLEDDWAFLNDLMREWQVLACVIDADPQINEARRFARRFHGYVWLCRYRRGQTAKEVAVSEEEDGYGLAEAAQHVTPEIGAVASDERRTVRTQRRGRLSTNVAQVVRATGAELSGLDSAGP